METPPLPKDICDLIIENLPNTLTETQKEILTATCRNLADDYVTPNELYNAVIAATPIIQQFFTELQIETFLKDTFRGYSEIWVPIQFLLLIGLIFIVTIILIFTGTITVVYGIVIIFLSALFFTIIGIAEMDTLIDYLNNRETTFKNNVVDTFDKYRNQALLSAGSGYMVGGSLGIHSPNGLFNPDEEETGPWYISLSNSSEIYDLTPPYSKLTIFQLANSNTYHVYLFEPKIHMIGLDRQMLKPSYPKVIYIVNMGPGQIIVDNASVTWTIDNNGAPLTNEGTNVTIASGQCRGFMNVNYSNTLFSKGFGASISASNWVLIS